MGSTASRPVTVAPGVETRIVERMRPGAVHRECRRRRRGAAAARTAAPFVPTPRPPRYVVVPVPMQEMETICLPAKPGPATDAIARIQRTSMGRAGRIYGKGDEIIVDAGAPTGSKSGRNLVVRRHYRRGKHRSLARRGEQTTGIVQIASVGEKKSTAVVVHACSEVRQGDYLASPNRRSAALARAVRTAGVRRSRSGSCFPTRTTCSALRAG